MQTAVGAGVELTDRLSVGFQGTVGSASMDGIFASISSSTPAYNLRAALGFTYELMDSTTIGGYWHTEQIFTFDDFFQVRAPSRLIPGLQRVAAEQVWAWHCGRVADGRQTARRGRPDVF